MKRTSTYEHPTSYEAIVAYQCARHERRLRELKAAEKAIRAVGGDLAMLAKRGLLVEVGEHSLRLIDRHICFGTAGQSKWALYVRTGIFSETSDRFVEGFMDLGWVPEAIDTKWRKVLLRRPKTQARIVVDLSEAFATTLQSRGVAQ